MLFKPEGAPLGNPFPEKELGVRTPNPPSHCQRNRGSPNPNPSPQRNQGSPNPNTPPPQQNQVSPNPNLGWVPNPPPLPGNQTRGRLVSRTLRSRTPLPLKIKRAGVGFPTNPPPWKSRGRVGCRTPPFPFENQGMGKLKEAFLFLFLGEGSRDYNLTPPHRNEFGFSNGALSQTFDIL